MKLYGLHSIFRIRLYIQLFAFFIFRIRYFIQFFAFLTPIVISYRMLLNNYPITNITDPVRYCYVDQSSHQFTVAGLQRLEDVLLSDRKPTMGRSIFFHETSCHLPPKSNVNVTFDSFIASFTLQNDASIIRLNPRQACAVESAALHNPNFDIYVLFASAAYNDNRNPQPLLDAVLSYPNVRLRKVNLWSYAADTPIYEWMYGGKVFSSKFVLSHISDFLRYLTLWRWGGTYLDLDVIVQKSLEDVPPNYAGAECNGVGCIAAGVMNFAPDGFGHEVAEECLIDFQENFSGNDWGNNGPGVISRVIQNVCLTEDTAMMNRERCLGFNVFPKESFYAIPWRMWQHFFEAQYLEETLKQTENSYAVHVWNKHSMQRRVKVGSNVAYGKLAEQHCPKVYAACGEFF